MGIVHKQTNKPNQKSSRIHKIETVSIKPIANY